MNLTHSLIAFKYQNYKKNSAAKKKGFQGQTFEGFVTVN